MNRRFRRQDEPSLLGDREDDHGVVTRDLRFVWLLIGIGIIVVAVVYLLGSISTALWAIAATALVVFLLRRSVAWLARHGVPRIVASMALVLLMMVIITMLLVSLLPMFFEQALGLLDKMPGYMEQLQQWWATLMAPTPGLENGTAALQEFVGMLVDALRKAAENVQAGLVSQAYNVGVSLMNIVIVSIMTFIVSFWILLDYDRLGTELHILFGRTAQWYATLVSTIASRVMSGFIKGTLIGALIIAVACGVAYFVMGIDFSLALGILAGLLSIVPYLGPLAMAVIIALVSMDLGPVLLIVAIAITVAVPWVIGTFVSPKVMSATVNLHPGVSILAILAGGALGGPAGMILAIPVVAIFKCLFVYFFESITGRQLISPDGAFFRGTPSEKIDPVADATDSFLTEQGLFEHVERVEDTVPKLESLPQRHTRSLLHDLAQPMSAYEEQVLDEELGAQAHQIPADDQSEA